MAQRTPKEFWFLLLFMIIEFSFLHGHANASKTDAENVQNTPEESLNDVLEDEPITHKDVAKARGHIIDASSEYRDELMASEASSLSYFHTKPFKLRQKELSPLEKKKRRRNKILGTASNRREYFNHHHYDPYAAPRFFFKSNSNNNNNNNLGSYFATGSGYSAPNQGPSSSYGAPATGPVTTAGGYGAPSGGLKQPRPYGGGGGGKGKNPIGGIARKWRKFIDRIFGGVKNVFGKGKGNRNPKGRPPLRPSGYNAPRPQQSNGGGGASYGSPAPIYQQQVQNNQVSQLPPSQQYSQPQQQPQQQQQSPQNYQISQSSPPQQGYSQQRPQFSQNTPPSPLPQQSYPQQQPQLQLSQNVPSSPSPLPQIQIQQRPQPQIQLPPGPSSPFQHDTNFRPIQPTQQYIQLQQQKQQQPQQQTQQQQPIQINQAGDTYGSPVSAPVTSLPAQSSGGNFGLQSLPAISSFGQSQPQQQQISVAPSTFYGAPVAPVSTSYEGTSSATNPSPISNNNNNNNNQYSVGPATFSLPSAGYGQQEGSTGQAPSGNRQPEVQVVQAPNSNGVATSSSAQAPTGYGLPQAPAVQAPAGYGIAAAPPVQSTGFGQPEAPAVQALTGYGIAAAPPVQSSTGFEQPESPAVQAPTGYGIAAAPPVQSSTGFEQPESPAVQAPTGYGIAAAPPVQASTGFGQSGAPAVQAPTGYGIAAAPPVQAPTGYGLPEGPAIQASTGSGQSQFSQSNNYNSADQQPPPVPNYATANSAIAPSVLPGRFQEISEAASTANPNQLANSDFLTVSQRPGGDLGSIGKNPFLRSGSSQVITLAPQIRSGGSRLRNNNIYDVIEGHADDDDHPGDRGIRGALVDSAYMRQKNRDMTAVKKAYLKYMRMMKEYESKYDQDDPELARFRQEILGNTLFSSTPSDYIYELQAPRLVEEIKRSSSSHAIRVSEPNPSGSTHRPVVTQQKTSGHRDRYPKSQGTYVSFERYGNRKPEELENAILGTFETAAIRRKRRQRKEKDTTSVDSSSQRVRFLTKTKTAGEGGSEYDDQQTAFSTDGSTFVIDGKEEEDSDSGSSRPLDVFDLTGGVTRVKQPYEQILTPNYYDGQTGEYV